MPRSSRVLWLPALAVLLPCLFIGVLGYFWFQVEREAAGLRGTKAAQAAVDMLRRDLEAHLRGVGEAAIAARAVQPASRPPFQPPPPCADPCADALVFDASGAPVDPIDAAALADESQGLVPRDGRGLAALDQVEDLERRGLHSEAMTAARALLEGPVDLNQRAAVLLALARLSAAAGRTEEADRFAKTIGACCPAERDELGASFALYAAWQRVGLYDARRDTDGARLGVLAAELGDLIERSTPTACG